MASICWDDTTWSWFSSPGLVSDDNNNNINTGNNNKICGAINMTLARGQH